MNAADHGSRGRKLAMPAPRRAWVHDFFTGDVDALDRRIRCSEPTGASTPDWRADHDAKEFDATLGYPGEGPAALGPRAAGRNQRARASVDLRVRAQGAGSRPQDLERLRVRFGVWLAAGGHPNLAALSADPVRLDGLLADYGQCLWSSDESQGTFAETLNAVRHKYAHLQYQLKGAWQVRTAWQHLEPGTSRAPFPPVLLCALVAACLL